MRPRLTTTVLGAAAGSVLLLTGCGGPTQTNAGGAPAMPLSHVSSAPATTSVTTAQEQQQQSGPPKCASADVHGVFGPADSVESGTTQLSIVATNTSDHTCTVHGYGGLEIHTGGDGSTIQLKLTRVPTPAAKSVTLKPGDKAYKKLRWQIPRTDEEKAGCDQGASYAYVTLPDDTKTFEVHPADGSETLPDICDGSIDGFAWSATDQTEQG